MDVMEKLVFNVLDTAYEDLTVEAIEKTKLAILDTLGCVIAGASAPGCPSVRDLVVDWGGKEESTLMVYGGKVPCPNAALVNSTVSRALDFDTTWERGIHMSAASVITALAVAETMKGVSGKELLSAIVAGEDLAARVHLATSDYNGAEPTGVCGIFGLAAIAGKIMGLDEGQMSNALGIAFNRAAGSYQSIIDGALVVRVMEGLASRSGIESALLAQKGISGGKNTLQGLYGYFHIFSQDKYDERLLTDGLGEQFVGVSETTFKKYPACGGTLTAVYATIQLVTENDIMPHDVEEVTVDCSPFFHGISGKPFKLRENPQVDAQFSYQYTVATAIVKRRFTIEDIMPDAIRDPEVLRIVEKVQPRINNNLMKESSRATIVSIRTKKGKSYSKQVNFPRGSRQNPMDKSEIMEKFGSCLNFAGKPIYERNGESLIQLVDRLENIGDVTEVIQLMVV